MSETTTNVGSRSEFSSRLIRLVIAFALAFVGATAGPRHACRLSSPALCTFILVICLLIVPLIAFGASKAKVGWIIAAAAPLMAFAGMWLYIDLLHWKHFPPALIEKTSLSTIRACEANRKQIQMAKADWAAEEHKSTNDTPTDADLFGADLYIRDTPQCPEGGTYILGRVGQPVRCSLKQHADRK